MKHGKKYREAAAKVDLEKLYPLTEAVQLVKETSTTKFDGSVEIHVRLGVDPKQADQNIRTTISLPHGSGKTVRLAAFVSDDDVKAATEAGADVVGNVNLLEEIGKGKIDFDIMVATPDMMKELSKVAKILGQKGLMPNPKAGTVGPDAAKMIKEIKAGRMEVRVDANSILHNVVGKVSFDEGKLVENVQAYLETVNKIKPASVKGTYLQAVSLASSMGPGIKLDLKETA